MFDYNELLHVLLQQLTELVIWTFNDPPTSYIAQRCLSTPAVTFDIGSGREHVLAGIVHVFRHPGCNTVLTSFRFWCALHGSFPEHSFA